MGELFFGGQGEANNSLGYNLVMVFFSSHFLYLIDCSDP